ncbi:hypothetical protein CROQUDRAFT_658095, partial [Cronartium quercuum f. sp. fusiforme G11]
GNYMTYKNDHPWEVSITVNKDMNISQFQSLIFSGCDKHYQDISEGLKKALFQGFQKKDDFEKMTLPAYDCFIHECFINSQQMIYLNFIQQNPKLKLKKESHSQGNFQKESTVVNSYEEHYKTNLQELTSQFIKSTADRESCMHLVNPQNRDQLLKLNTAMIKVWAQDIAGSGSDSGSQLRISTNKKLSYFVNDWPAYQAPQTPLQSLQLRSLWRLAIFAKTPCSFSMPKPQTNLVMLKSW